MVKQIKWNDRATADLYKIAKYLEENVSYQSAQNFADRVRKRVEDISKHPSMGRKAPKRKTIRFVLLGKHRRIYYRTQGQTLIISSIFDTRQHPGKDFHS